MAHLSNDRLLQFRFRSKEWAGSDRSLYFQSGREAFLALLRSITVCERRIVLMPSYAPEGLFAPAVAAGWQVKMYSVGPDLSPNWDSLAASLDLYRPEVAVLIHHFGVPQDGNRFAEICRATGALSVEDQAHIATLPERKLPASTDVVITSLPKIFGITDGSTLSLVGASARNLSPNLDSRHANPKYILAQAGALVMSTLANKLSPRSAAFIGKVSGRLFRPYSVLMNGFTTVRPMSRLSRILLAHTDISQEIERRIRLARLYANHLDRNVFEHLLPCPPSTHGLFGYPILVKEREALVRHLAANKISGTILCNGWDFRSEVRFNLNDGSERILCEHFLFPLSARLSISDVMHVIDVANKWAKLPVSQRRDEARKDEK